MISVSRAENYKTFVKTLVIFTCCQLMLTGLSVADVATSAVTAAVTSSINVSSKDASNIDTTKTEKKKISHRILSSSLSKFMEKDEQIVLRNAASEIALFIPLSERYEIQKANLHLEFFNSIALLKERSLLTVKMNGRMVGQIPLTPSRPQNIADISVPASLFKHGYNELTIEAAQHYTNDCEDPTAPELWTQIDTVNSTIALNIKDKALTKPLLSELDQMINSRVWEDYYLTVLTPGGKMDDDYLRWGGLVAEGVALRLKYIPLRVSHLEALPRDIKMMSQRSPKRFHKLDLSIVQQSDAILMGTRDELEPYLDNELISEISGSYMGIFPFDDDPSRFLLVISGLDKEGVNRAALAFAHLNFPLPDSTSTIINSVDIPSLPAYTRRASVKQNSAYRFSQFGFKTTTLTGNKLSNKLKSRVEVWIPPDFFSAERSESILSFHLAYGAGMGVDSVLNLMLNDKFINAIALDDQKGGVFRDYQVRVPLRSFAPGRNVISIEPQLSPMQKDRCSVSSTDNLVVTIFDDSKLLIPAADHFVRLPDIKLFATTGFPYTKFPDGSDMSIQVASNDSESISASWTLLSKLAQTNTMPFHNAQMTFGTPDKNRNQIIIGAQSAIDSALLNASPLAYNSLQNAHDLHYAMYDPLDSEVYFSNWWTKFQSKIVNALGFSPAQAEPAFARVSQQTGFGSQGNIMQFESPVSSGKTVTIFTAENADFLLQRMREAMDPKVWGALQGDLVVWKETPESVRWQKLSTNYNVGNVSISTRAEYYFIQHPWYSLAIIIGMIILLVVLTRVLLTRFKRAHHA
ncbi:MAG: cellulose biosynthesis cyclic di-GMP-binding regulatory protein BcsB [Gammaproteobacteria bacterium]|nr:cellulose biosynthesis cyclic di-GMP-binding regulatory protein BcsB [Gammaproteobacteria bacterium]